MEKDDLIKQGFSSKEAKIIVDYENSNKINPVVKTTIHVFKTFFRTITMLVLTVTILYLLCTHH